MGRRSHGRALNVWANGLLVGQWRIPVRGSMEFQYDRDWVASPEGRPLSLSLPMSLDNLPIKGDVVGYYFDNLLPDSDLIRKRLQGRYHVAHNEAFELLEAIGRDCVGAIQLLSDKHAPDNVYSILAEPLDDATIERLITSGLAPRTLGMAFDEDELDDFRISIAGAQEKTALLKHNGQWCKPLKATPTTHILKLPMGLVGHMQADMRTSVENEWLCSKILEAYGMDVASCEIQQFGSQKALVVERFDRQLHSSGSYWLRLPQEDFCQATGVPASKKYEVDGGPGLAEISKILLGSVSRDKDLETLLKTQLIFWMLAATDGHAKNFSIKILSGGRYQLTKLYDVLSTWPVIGEGPNQLDWYKRKLAIALRGKNVHYRLRDIQRRHFNESARRCGLGSDMEAIIQDTIDKTPNVLDKVGNTLPQDFPMDVYDKISAGVRLMAEKLKQNVTLNKNNNETC